jgi:hypothetical protein
MLKDMKTMMNRLEFYISTWGMLRQIQMEEEIGKSMSL